MKQFLFPVIRGTSIYLPHDVFYARSLAFSKAMYTELLNPRSIRLLDIAPGQASDLVSANLLILDDLYEGAEFAALSYDGYLIRKPLAKRGSHPNSVLHYLK